MYTYILAETIFPRNAIVAYTNEIDHAFMLTVYMHAPLHMNTNKNTTLLHLVSITAKKPEPVHNIVD